MLEYSFISGDPEQDFLTQNPELRYFPFVQKMINSTPELVNNIMWSLYIVEHPKAKVYYHVPMEQRIEIAENRYKVCYAEDCVPYRKDFCEASMHPISKPGIIYRAPKRIYRPCTGKHFAN